MQIVQKDDAIVRVEWAEYGNSETTPLLKEAQAQIDAYFAGTLRVFDLPLSVRGSDFQKKVCDAIYAIPFGETRRYGDLAKDIGVSAQAVGGGCGGNPIPLIIPCHRVLAATGLGGFSGSHGVETKVALLRHEGAASLLI
ncbi:methylated-DNA-[protein]-cysteine S-methyltransferase [Pelagimonas varians]|uniref:Methylated-DNA--protein-cysteine methyltransferase n=2 Tax=Pelagimonas varians TaxID=696760 RepID=A0A238K4U3_9RHOB|nr:methylated-DNA-[protein]-cysteine S-methyltransferase [Pelagimonas varians]SMX37112.1 Methylated-DNA--protein-cysteine methyltransferase [Pelagimonas varians]